MFYLTLTDSSGAVLDRFRIDRSAYISDVNESEEFVGDETCNQTLGERLNRALLQAEDFDDPQLALGFPHDSPAR